MRSLFAAIISLAALLGPRLALASSPEAMPDRPDASDSTSTMQPGWAQLELGALASRESAADTSVGTPFVLRVGLSEPIELRLGGDGFVWRSTDEGSEAGVGDLSMGFKIRFFDEGDWYPSVGLEPVLIVPVASRARGLGSGRPTFLGTLLASKDLFAGLHADANVAINAVGVEGRGGEFHAQGLVSLSLSRSFLGGALTPFAEVYGMTGEAPGDPITANTDFGVVALVHRRVAIDAAADIGLTEAAPRFTGTVGVTLLLGQLF
jgi:hypothetical protein